MDAFLSVQQLLDMGSAALIGKWFDSWRDCLARWIEDMHGHWSVLGLDRGRGQFLNFLNAPMILYRKKCFLAVNASLRWLNNVSGVLLNPGFLASYWSAGFGRFLQVSALASHWQQDCANFTPTPEEKTNTIAFLVQYKHQANPLLSMNNYTRLEISRNDKKFTANIIKPTQTGLNRNT